ncbi:hypothetical protein RQP46_001021 [Phenoliferia psychrophenolica]
MHTTSLFVVSALAIAPAALASGTPHAAHAARDGTRHGRRVGSKRQSIPTLPTNFASMAPAALGTQATPTAALLSLSSLWGDKPLPTAAAEPFMSKWGAEGSSAIDVSALAASLGSKLKATGAPVTKRWEKDTGGTTTIHKGNEIEVEYWTSREWGSGDEGGAASSSSDPAATSSAEAAAATATTAKKVAVASKSVYDLGTVQAQSLDAHNVLREKKGADALAWNSTLADAAMNWVHKCEFADGGMSGVGSNVAYIGSYDSTVPQQIKMWSDEESLYNADNPTYADSYGHYTQMVWKGTYTVGCAMAACDPIHVDGDSSSTPTSNFLNCLYYPEGNIEGASYFKDNVEA